MFLKDGLFYTTKLQCLSYPTMYLFLPNRQHFSIIIKLILNKFAQLKYTSCLSRFSLCLSNSCSSPITLFVLSVNRDLLKNDLVMYVPEIIDELTTSQVLVQELIYGEPLDKGVALHQDIRNMVRFFRQHFVLRFHIFALIKSKYVP